MSIYGCSSLSTPPENKTVVEVREKIVEIEREIPAELLKKCQAKPEMKGDTLGDLAEVVIKDNKISEECRERHNTLVDYINEASKPF